MTSRYLGNIMAAVDDTHPWCQNLNNLPDITFEKVEKFIQINSKTPKASDQRGFTLFDGGYIHKYEVQYRENTAYLRARCYHSQSKNADPHILKVSLSKVPLQLEAWNCTCKAGKGFCQHIIALLYQTAHYKKKGCKVVPPEISRTSTSQKWGIPKRSEGFCARPIDQMEVHKVKKEKSAQEKKKQRKVADGVRSTLYNPVATPLMDLDMASKLEPLLQVINPRPQILDLLDSQSPATYEESRFGSVPYGCTIANQHPKNDTKLIDPADIPDFDFKELTLYGAESLNNNENLFFNGMKLPKTECIEVEKLTRDQSKVKCWHDIRKKRLTASKAHRITARRGNFPSLAEKLKKPVRQTAAMLDGLNKEPEAFKVYTEDHGLNTYPVGFVINPSAPHIGCSPDRRVYDPDEENSWGLLEVKCPQAQSYTNLSYLKPTPKGDFKLKVNNEYYTQVMVQMGITGCSWCDFFVLCEVNQHWERIYFAEDKFQEFKEKLDLFFFNHFLPHLMHS